jgi:hypothetical protein
MSRRVGGGPEADADIPDTWGGDGQSDERHGEDCQADNVCVCMCVW